MYRTDLQCTRCLRIVPEYDPDVVFSHNEVVKCGSCDPDLLFRERPVIKCQRTTTVAAARRYVRRYGGEILSSSIDRPLKLYRGNRESGYFLVAIVPPISNANR